MTIQTFISEVDDGSVSFHYSGSWSPIKGNASLEFQGTVHSTTQQGASAATRFIATRAIIYITIPAGPGTSVRATVSLDGHTTEITRPATSSPVFANVLFDSGTLSNSSHTLILTNSGSSTDSPLQFDRLHLQGSPILDVGPVTLPIVLPTQVPSSTSAFSTSSSQSSGNPVQVLPPTRTPLSSASVLQSSLPTVTDSSGGAVSLPQDFKATSVTDANGEQITTAPTTTLLYSHLITSTEANGTVVTEIVDSPSTQSTSSAARGMPGAVIVGCVIGVLGLIAFAIILLLLRLRIRRAAKGHMRLPDETYAEVSNITPFDIRERHTISESSATRTTYHEAAGEFPRNEKTGSLYTTNASSSSSALPQGPNQDRTNIPHHRTHSASSSTIVSPDAASPTYSTAMRPSWIPSHGRSSDLPPSYQFNP